MIWTPPKLVQWIKRDFEEKGFPPPHRYQAELLVSHALNISRLDIYLQHDKPCTPEEQKTLRQLVKRRYQREPIAYILGTCEFWTLTLAVGPGVLIPRQETEILVENAVNLIKKRTGTNPYHILELGIGSAAIPLALCSELTDLEIISTEYSRDALRFARKNLLQHSHLLKDKNNWVQPVQTDKFSAVKQNPLFDMIISNPPYIPHKDLHTLQAEVSQWEPNIALSGGDDGTDFYKYLLESASDFLKPGGYLLFEHGFDQADPIKTLISSHKSVQHCQTLLDYAGHERVAILQKV